MHPLTLNQLVEGSSPSEPKFNKQEGFNPLLLCQNIPLKIAKGTQKGTLGKFSLIDSFMIKMV